VKKKKKNHDLPKSRVKKKMQKIEILKKIRTRRKSRRLRRNCNCSGASGKRREETAFIILFLRGNSF
jgi:hypothetical protein